MIGLSFFFAKRDATVKKVRDRFEVEFDAYVADAIAELEQCPLKWWQENGSTYSYLNGAAKRFLCVPAIIQNMKIPLNRQVLVFNNRMMLQHTKQIDAMLWLNSLQAN